MQKAGGIVAIIAGVFAVMAALTTLMLGGLGAAFEAEGFSTIVGLGWGGLAFAFGTIVLGAVSLSAKTKTPGVLLIVSSLLGAILGGTLVALFMALAMIGGVLATVGVKKRAVESAPSPEVG